MAKWSSRFCTLSSFTCSADDLAGLRVVVVEALGDAVDAAEVLRRAVVQLRRALEELVAGDAGRGDGRHVGELRDQVEVDRLAAEQRLRSEVVLYYFAGSVASGSDEALPLSLGKCFIEIKEVRPSGFQ